MTEHQGEIEPYKEWNYTPLTEQGVLEARAKSIEAGLCPGPIRVSGAVFDPSAIKAQDRWINNPQKPLLEVCEHGKQTSHPISVVSKPKRARNTSNGRGAH